MDFSASLYVSCYDWLACNCPSNGFCAAFNTYVANVLNIVASTVATVEIWVIGQVIDRWQLALGAFTRVCAR